MSSAPSPARLLFRLLVLASATAAVVAVVLRRREAAEIAARAQTDQPANPAAPITPWQPSGSASAQRSEAAPAGEVEPGAFEGSAAPLADGSAPGPDWTIKAKASSMLFHTQASGVYARAKADAWFRTEEDAEAAGFRKHR